jgi:hypothetical protein
MSNIDKYTKFMSEQAKTTSTGLFGTYKTGFVTEAEQPINEAKIDVEGGSDHAIEVMGDALKKHGVTIKKHGSIGDADKLTFHKNGKQVGEHHVDWKDGAEETARGIHDQVKDHANFKLQTSGDYIHIK